MQDITKRIQALPAAQREEVARLLREKLQDKQADRENAVFDVVILGGGLAGSTLARQLKQSKPEIRVLVVEKHKHPVPEAAFKVGESTVELGSYYLRDILGLAEHLDACHLPKAGLRCFMTAGDNRDISRRVELGTTQLLSIRTNQVDRGRFENALCAENQRQGIEFWDGCQAREILFGADLHRVTIQRAAEEVTVSARWVVDASGRAQILKRRLGLAEESKHQINAVWFRLGAGIDIDEWSSDPAWQARVADGLRRLSTNHLMGRGYWVWLIPLASGSISVGIVADEAVHPLREMNQFERALDWLKTFEPQCAQAVEERRHLLQDFLAIKHYSHGCRQVFSRERWCITGDAGVFVDPFYSPGTDFIAMSNSVITDLITRDLDGLPFEERLEQANVSYLSMFKLFMVTYENQYPLMGNPEVMVTKIVWDWAIYWGVTVPLFIHGNKLFDVEWSASVRSDLQRFNNLNARMQSFFREWDRGGQREWSGEFVEFLGFRCLHELYQGLHARLSDDELKTRLRANIGMLERLAADCQAHQGLENLAGVH